MDAYNDVLEIRRQLLTEEDGESVLLNQTRLTVPLKSAQRAVSTAVSVISTLSPSDRKSSCETLIDIAGDSLRAVEKVLRRGGTADTVLLSKARKIIRLMDEFDQSFSNLVVKESVEGEYHIPGELDDGEIQDTADVLAYRIFSDNSDFSVKDAEAAEKPSEGEANDSNISAEEGEADEKVIQTLADPPEGVEEEVPLVIAPRIPSTLQAKSNVDTIHESADSNFAVLRNIFNHM